MKLADVAETLDRLGIKVQCKGGFYGSQKLSLNW
jgi:hypothetical protein